MDRKRYKNSWIKGKNRKRDNRQCDINLVLEESEPEKKQQNRNQFLGVVKPRTRQSSAGQQVAPGGHITVILHYYEDLNYFRLLSGLISVLCKAYINQRGSGASPEQETVPGLCHPEPPPLTHSLQSHLNTQRENIFRKAKVY